MRTPRLPSMTGLRYKEVLVMVGLNQTTAGYFFGAHGVTGRRWAKVGPPEPVAKFLRLMLALRLSVQDVKRLLEA